MKSFKLIITLLFLISSPFIISADDVYDEFSDNNDNVIEVKDHSHNPTGRPKAPNRQHIDCNYINGMIYIQFSIPEGMCELTVIDTETGDSQIHCFDTSNGVTFINIGIITSFELYFKTEKGNAYYGYK